jgi:hypothetical protein
METNVIDIVFWVFITVIVLGGLACLIVFLPKEHNYEDSKNDCFRIEYRDGIYKISNKKPSYGENKYSLRSKYFYIKKAPFEADACCDDGKAPDGKSYRAVTSLRLCFPEDKLQTFAPTFHGVPHESIIETVEEALASAMKDAIAKYDPSADGETFKETVRECAKEKLDIFGVYIMSVGNIRISENT